jgi:hypothetical protein
MKWPWGEMRFRNAFMQFTSENASPLSPFSTKYESRSISTKLTEAAFIHPHGSKGKASCIPPERHLIKLQ